MTGNKDLLRVYCCNIQGLSGGKKIPRVKSRSFDSDIVVLNEVNKSVDDDLFIGCKFGQVSNTPNPDRTGPGFGTFIGSKEFNADKGDKFVKHDKFEINICCRHFKNFSACIIGVYRSPNMDNYNCDQFYLELDKYVTEYESKFDILVVLGDDNSHNDLTSSSKARRAHAKLEELRKKHKGYHIVNQNTRQSHQTDHVVAFYDIFKFDIDHTVTPGVGDHDEMNIFISSAVILPDPERWVKTEVMVDEGDPALLAETLSRNLEVLSMNYVRSFEANGERPVGPQQHDLDMLLDMFMSGINDARNACKITIRRTMPIGKGSRLGSREQRHVTFLKNKLAKIHRKFQKSGSDEDKDKRDKLASAIREAQESAARVDVTKDMQHMHKFQKHDSRRFFEATGKHLKQDQLEKPLSKDQIQAKLEAAEDNYKVRGPPLSRADWDYIVPDRQFRIPWSVKDVEEAIMSAKKIDGFYKRYAKQIAPAFSAIMYIVSKYFIVPSECKITKLTFLKSRTIFSCNFETRILETLVNKGLDEVWPDDEHGQMAYQKGRSTQLCVAIGLDESEKHTDLCLQWSADQQKAFDSARHSTICQVFQKEAGAGEFTHQFFTNRNYRYNGELGFKRFPMGRGAPPGDLISPRQFSAFQSTDVSSSLRNPTYEWPANFSDDKFGLVRWHNVVNGKLQESLNATWKWSQDNFVDYHLSGKKAPEYFVIRKKSSVTKPEIAQGLFLGETEVKRGYETCQLGITIRYYRDDETASDHGYSLTWESKKSPFARLAYRFQDIRHWWDPEMRWRCVDSYMIGKISYGSSLYWLRAEAEQIDQVRFFYSMAMASVLGLETPEAISLQSCKKQAVKSNNAGFLKLCKFLNMPTLKDLAIMEARVLLRHWKSYRPHEFQLGEKLEILDVNREPGCLLSDLLKLANTPTNDWYPEYRVYCHKRKTSKVPVTIDQDDKPLWRQYWEEVKRVCPKSDPSFRERLFMMSCRDYFEVAEPYSRVKKHLDPPTLIPSQIRSADVAEIVAGTSDQPLDKRSKTRKLRAPKNSLPVKKGRKRGQEATSEVFEVPVSKLTCQIGHPPVRGVKNRTCRICGYVIRSTLKQRKSGVVVAVKFSCCDKEAHLDCWHNARSSENAELECREVMHWLSSDKLTPKTVKVAPGNSDQPTITCRECEFCHDLIEISDKNRNHLFEDCGKSRNIDRTCNEPQSKRRKGVVSVVGRFYELIRGQATPGSDNLETRSNRDENPPAITSGIDPAIAEVGVT